MLYFDSVNTPNDCRPVGIRRMAMLAVSTPDWNYPWWANLAQKINLSWDLEPRQLYAEFNGGVHFIRFRLKIPFLEKLGPKNQNCQFKLKFGNCPNSNTQNSIVMFTYSLLDRKSPFRANLVQKVKIVSLSWSLVSRLIRVPRIQWRC